MYILHMGVNAMYLRDIYKEIFQEEFNYEILNDRIKLQKAIYLLENMGISVGDYSFSLNQYGPYSLELDVDAQRYNVSGAVDFSDVAKRAFGIIRNFIAQREFYEEVQWLECVTTMHYLKFMRRMKNPQIIKKLADIKPYLDNATANEAALNIVNQIQIVC